MELPPAVAWLVGEWEGEGSEEYPGCDAFTYRTQMVFSHARLDRLVLAYSEHTWLLPDGAPSHEEAGYLRATEDGSVELVVAHPIGVVEVHVGTATDDRIELESLTVAHTPSGSAVTQTRRLLEHGANDALRYQLDMAANGKPLVHHCEATLHRV